MPLVFCPGCDQHASHDRTTWKAFEPFPGFSRQSKCQENETLNLPVSFLLIACKMLSIIKFRPSIRFFSLIHKLDVNC